MISAKLAKDLEEKGFSLEFPKYTTNEERITDILKEKNARLNTAIPLLLKEKFDYNKIIRKLKSKEDIIAFNKIIIIASEIFKEENIDNSRLREIIEKNKIKEKFTKNEMEYYHDAFREAKKRTSEGESSGITEQISLRNKLDINTALAEIYSPAKIRIMKKIFNHEKLTNTELKYSYKAISPISRAILNAGMQEYLRIIEHAKKLHA